MGKVLVRQIVTTVDTVEGTETWVEDGPTVEGMVAGGYWEVVTPVASVAAGRRRKGDGGGVDQAEQGGDDGGAEPSGVA